MQEAFEGFTASSWRVASTERSTVKTWLLSHRHSRLDRCAPQPHPPASLRRRDGSEAWEGAVLLESRVALRELADLLDGLPAEQRAALVLKAVEGLTTPEIASILSCSEGAVEQRLVRARAALRERRKE